MPGDECHVHVSPYALWEHLLAGIGLKRDGISAAILLNREQQWLLGSF
jgi:hypothetical protein